MSGPAAAGISLAGSVLLSEAISGPVVAGASLAASVPLNEAISGPATLDEVGLASVPLCLPSAGSVVAGVSRSGVAASCFAASAPMPSMDGLLPLERLLLLLLNAFAKPAPYPAARAAPCAVACAALLTPRAIPRPRPLAARRPIAPPTRVAPIPRAPPSMPNKLVTIFGPLIKNMAPAIIPKHCATGLC